MDASFRPVADFGLLVAFGDVFSDGAHDAVLALDQALSRDLPEGVVELVPALVNLMVVFDPIQTDHDAVQGAVQQCLNDLTATTKSGEKCIIDVCYDRSLSPDLDIVAQTTGLSHDAVINAHLGGDYRVLMFGFAPGYGYMGGVPDALQVPRKLTPVNDVPSGSVMIAGVQCLITTLKMPSGWSVIGHSPTPVLTGNQDKPTVFSVGDHVSFNRISMDDYLAATKGDVDG